MAEEVGDLRLELDNIDYLSQIYLKQNSSIEALVHLKKAEALIHANPSYQLEMIKIYAHFFRIYLKENNYKQASIYQQNTLT